MSEERRIIVPRSARYYTAGSSTAPECWLVCHGYGQLAGRFIRHFQPIAGNARYVVAPEGLHRFYLDPADRPAAQRRVGATWMTREDRAADISDYIAYLDRVYAAECVGRQVHVLGFSQGVATVARWAAASSAPLERLILWGSLLPPDFDWLRGTERLRQMEVVLVMGSQDHFASADQLRELQDTTRNHDLQLRILHYDGGHVIDAATLQQIADALYP